MPKSEVITCEKCGTVMNFSIGGGVMVEQTVPDCPRCRGDLRENVEKLEWDGWVEE